MKRTRKSNRVSWAPGVNLCQVKLFLKEDCPLKVSGEHQDMLKAKTSLKLHPSGMFANDLPPGFEGSNYANGSKYDLAEMPSIRWTCPPKFVLNSNWHVAAGEESEEIGIQKLREMRLLEAVYPRHSVIPPNPSVSRDVELEPYHDSQVPLVPLTPIEDEENANIISNFAAQPKTPSNSKTATLPMPPGLSVSGTHGAPYCPSSAAELPVPNKLPGISSGVILAASAALTAAMKSKELGSMVDTDLLVKILSDPKMVEKLIHDHGHLSMAANGNVVRTPVCTSEPDRGTASLPSLKPATISSPMPDDRDSKQLVKEIQPATSIPTSSADIVSVSMPSRVEPSVSVSSPGINMISRHRAANSNPYSTLNQVQPAISMMQQKAGLAVASVEANPVKDANYVKNLIREHGRERQEAKGGDYDISQNASHFNHKQNLKLVRKLNPGALKTKYRKTCMFFNSPKGCRQGFNCPYLHDKSFQWQSGKILDAPSAKRMKLGREITGRI